MAGKKKPEKKQKKTRREMAQELWRKHEKKSDVLYSYELFFLGIVFAVIGALWAEALYDYFILGDESYVSTEFLITISIIMFVSMVLVLRKFNSIRREVEKLERDARRIMEMEPKK
jgi:hypothetical protein